MTRPDPVAQAIRDVHALGEELGFVKLRIDRYARLADDAQMLCYFEVGYGCREVKIRTYAGNGDSVGIYRADVDKVDFETVLDLLTALIDATEGTRV